MLEAVDLDQGSEFSSIAQVIQHAPYILVVLIQEYLYLAYMTEVLFKLPLFFFWQILQSMLTSPQVQVIQHSQNTSLDQIFRILFGINYFNARVDQHLLIPDLQNLCNLHSQMMSGSNLISSRLLCISLKRQLDHQCQM